MYYWNFSFFTRNYLTSTRYLSWPLHKPLYNAIRFCTLRILHGAKKIKIRKHINFFDSALCWERLGLIIPHAIRGISIVIWALPSNTGLFLYHNNYSLGIILNPHNMFNTCMLNNLIVSTHVIFYSITFNSFCSAALQFHLASSFSSSHPCHVPL
jgi:hypothetical protein